MKSRVVSYEKNKCGGRNLESNGLERVIETWDSFSLLRMEDGGVILSKIYHVMVWGLGIRNWLKRRCLDTFSNHFCNIRWHRLLLRNGYLKRLSSLDGEWLEEEFSSDEVWKAFRSCDGNKAPGLDGLNLNFFKANWDMMREDMKFFYEFH